MALPGSGPGDEDHRPGDPAVVAENPEPVAADDEVEKFQGEKARHRGRDESRPVRRKLPLGDPCDVPRLQEERPQDRRDGKEEREGSGRFPVDLPEEGEGDRRPGPGNSRKEGRRLGDPDDQGIRKVHVFLLSVRAWHPVGEIEKRARDEKEESRRPGRGEKPFNLAAEGQAQDSRDGGGRDEKQEKPPGNGAARRLLRRCRLSGRDRRGDLRQFASEKENDCQERPPVKDQIEEDPRLAESRKEPLGDDQVARAADGQKLGEALQDAEKDGFRDAQ